MCTPIWPLVLLTCLPSCPPPNPFQFKTQIKSPHFFKAQWLRIQLETRPFGADAQLLCLQLGRLGFSPSVPQFTSSRAQRSYNSTPQDLL